VFLQHDYGGYHTLYRLRLDGHYGAFDPRYGYLSDRRDAPDARILTGLKFTTTREEQNISQSQPAVLRISAWSGSARS